jgi:hypothetical protein
VAVFGVLVFMVRNLGILKISLLHPIRSDQNSIGPFEEILTPIEIIINGRKSTIERAKLVNKSKMRFISK